MTESANTSLCNNHMPEKWCGGPCFASSTLQHSDIQHTAVLRCGHACQHCCCGCNRWHVTQQQTGAGAHDIAMHWICRIGLESPVDKAAMLVGCWFLEMQWIHDADRSMTLCHALQHHMARHPWLIDRCLLLQTYETVVDGGCEQEHEFEIVRCTGHQHIGSRCITLYNADNGDRICQSCPVYGTEPGVVLPSHFAGNNTGSCAALACTVRLAEATPAM